MDKKTVKKLKRANPFSVRGLLGLGRRAVGIPGLLLIGLALAAGFLWGTNHVKNQYDILN